MKGSQRQAEVTRRAVKHYGKVNQLHVAIEELSELQKELCKDLRGIGDRNAIAEEIADVEIMLDQLKQIYHNYTKVETWKAGKINRLEYRMNRDKG